MPSLTVSMPTLMAEVPAIIPRTRRVVSGSAGFREAGDRSRKTQRGPSSCAAARGGAAVSPRRSRNWLSDDEAAASEVAGARAERASATASAAEVRRSWAEGAAAGAAARAAAATGRV